MFGKATRSRNCCHISKSEHCWANSLVPGSKLWLKRAPRAKVGNRYRISKSKHCWAKSPAPSSDWYGCQTSKFEVWSGSDRCQRLEIAVGRIHLFQALIETDPKRQSPKSLPNLKVKASSGKFTCPARSDWHGCQLPHVNVQILLGIVTGSIIAAKCQSLEIVWQPLQECLPNVKIWRLLGSFVPGSKLWLKRAPRAKVGNRYQISKSKHCWAKSPAPSSDWYGCQRSKFEACSGSDRCQRWKFAVGHIHLFQALIETDPKRQSPKSLPNLKVKASSGKFTCPACSDWHGCQLPHVNVQILLGIVTGSIIAAKCQSLEIVWQPLQECLPNVKIWRLLGSFVPGSKLWLKRAPHAKVGNSYQISKSKLCMFGNFTCSKPWLTWLPNVKIRSLLGKKSYVPSSGSNRFQMSKFADCRGNSLVPGFGWKGPQMSKSEIATKLSRPIKHVWQIYLIQALIGMAGKCQSPKTVWQSHLFHAGIQIMPDTNLWRLLPVATYNFDKLWLNVRQKAKLWRLFGRVTCSEFCENCRPKVKLSGLGQGHLFQTCWIHSPAPSSGGNRCQISNSEDFGCRPFNRAAPSPLARTCCWGRAGVCVRMPPAKAHDGCSRNSLTLPSRQEFAQQLCGCHSSALI